MARLCPALVCALGVLILAPQAAAGGGWWSYIDVNRSTVAPGQRVEVHEELFVRSTAAEEAVDSGQFYVYLLRDFDYSVVERAMRKAAPRNWWSLGDAEAIQVGNVSVSVSDSNLGRASAAFTVPELPPASYHLMLCDAGCAEPLADAIPAKGFTIVADPATAQMAQRLDRLERRTHAQARQLTAARRDAEEAQDAAARDAHLQIEPLATRVSSLEDEVPPPAWWVHAGWLLACALAGALAVLILRRRRSPPRRSISADGSHPSDEELEELLSSESGHPR